MHQVKNKPAGHIKTGDVLIFKSFDGFKKTEALVSKVTEEDGLSVRVTFPATHVKLASGEKMEVSPKNYLIFTKNEQVYYKS